ncbi:HTH domain-containing protein [Pontibacter sp. G13]|uniref:HTH domain-containing protein n=1 Tax=Pontibacter sp. G13 TaxID=3074898 RepID=UPI00288AA281|nr:HTH domain-containing protein [Pontibacter sp. G13]WNJ19924.1 HTH domain-containing protein [Pontibacter sp. G13]
MAIPQPKTIKEAALRSLQDTNNPMTYKQVFDHIMANGYYDFGLAKTPMATVSALLGEFIRNKDSRVSRFKGSDKKLRYYLTQNKEISEKVSSGESDLGEAEKNGIKPQSLPSYKERDLHLLLSSFLETREIKSKTILHETSRNSRDRNQKWIHPDMVGVQFLDLKHKSSRKFLKSTDPSSLLNLSSYEIKKEIQTDSELKQYYFQAVSNSSWANFGYLVAFDFASSILPELERLNRSFGIGVIQLSADVFTSEILFPASYRDLDPTTMDKICHVNEGFREFLDFSAQLLDVEGRQLKYEEEAFGKFCDPFLKDSDKIEAYCLKHGILIKEEE